MIYYFSGTGNSKWVAEQLALKTEDTAVNIISCSAAPSVESQTIGIVFPIYAWKAPEPVLEFVKKLSGKPVFSYGVCTCGEEAGYAMENLSEIFHLDSMYSISMPNNYIIASDVESDEIISAKIAKAKERLIVIADQVNYRQSVCDVKKGKLPWIKSNLINFGFNQVARSTKPFRVTNACTSCGLCARICPSDTIKMIDGKPHWDKKCYQCMACINRCPEKAIQYLKWTRKRGRYYFTEETFLSD